MSETSQRAGSTQLHLVGSVNAINTAELLESNGLALTARMQREPELTGLSMAVRHASAFRSQETQVDDQVC